MSQELACEGAAPAQLSAPTSASKETAPAARILKPFDDETLGQGNPKLAPARVSLAAVLRGQRREPRFFFFAQAWRRAGRASASV